MNDIDFREHTVLGRTGLRVSRIGLAGGYKAPTRAVERAFHEYGINYFYWDRRRPGMQAALQGLVKTARDELVIAIQSFDHTGLWMRRSTEKALRVLGIERVDILFLGWVTKLPNRRIMDVTGRLRDEGKVGSLGFTAHNRSFHGEMARRSDSPFDVQMVRYNAAHRGAEQDVFADLPEGPPGIVTYTATRWGQLLRAKKMPPGEQPLSAAECYRFVLTHPAVNVCLAGPRSEREMDEGLRALTEGPLSDEELARVRRIGDHVHG
jgi:aryl-alcohol dehydrogenase-like predicted oxidoreductase